MLSDGLISNQAVIHFNAVYILLRMNTMLKKCAVPTIFEFPDHLMPKVKERRILQRSVEIQEVNGKHKMVTRRTIMEKTPLSEIFRGQLRTRPVINGENEPIENIEPLFTLKLDIGKAKSVREALDMLVNKYTLNGLTCQKPTVNYMRTNKLLLMSYLRSYYCILNVLNTSNRN